MQTSALETFISSIDPSPLSLAQFLTCASRIPDLFKAPIRTVDCFRCGIHEYLIIACELTLPSTGRLTTVWLRLERNPKQKTLRVLTGKPDKAADTIKASTRLELLHLRGESRGHFVYYLAENPQTTLRLENIIEMCDYFGQKSPSYALLKTNCRWLCYALFECLNQCQPCYGGQCMGSKLQSSWSQYDVQAVTDAKNNYLKAKHSACCIFQPPDSTINLLFPEPIPIPAPALGVVTQADQSPVNHTGSHFSAPFAPQPRHPTGYHEGHPTTDGFNVAQSPEHYYSPHSHPTHPGSRPFPQPRPSHAHSQVPSSQPSFDPYHQYHQNPRTQGLHNPSLFPLSRGTREETIAIYPCGGHGVCGCQSVPHVRGAAQTQSYPPCGPDCHHQHQVHPQLHPPHEPQARRQYHGQPQAQRPPHSNTCPYPQAQVSMIYSQPSENAHDPHRLSTHVPPGAPFHYAPQSSWDQTQPRLSQASVPSPSHNTASGYPNQQMPQPAPAPVPQAPPFNRDFANRMSAYGQMPVGGFMSSDISDHHNYGHTCSAPQPQPAPPNRTWTEQVWGSATTRPPLRTDSPGGIDTCTCGRDCAGGDTCLL